MRAPATGAGQSYVSPQAVCLGGSDLASLGLGFCSDDINIYSVRQIRTQRDDWGGWSGHAAPRGNLSSRPGPPPGKPHRVLVSRPGSLSTTRLWVLPDQIHRFCKATAMAEMALQGSPRLAPASGASAGLDPWRTAPPLIVVPSVVYPPLVHFVARPIGAALGAIRCSGVGVPGSCCPRRLSDPPGPSALAGSRAISVLSEV